MPPKPKEDKQVRNTGIRVTLTEDEKAAVEYAAWEVHDTVSNWAREILLAHLARKKGKAS